MGEPYEIMLPNNRLENLRRTWPLGAIPPYDLMSVGSWSGVPGASTRVTCHLLTLLYLQLEKILFFQSKQ